LRLSCRHRIPLPADRFWEILHEPAYEARVAEEVGLAEYVVLERREEPESVYRRIRVTPAVPGALQALLSRVRAGASAAYVEEQWRSRSAMEVRFRMTPDALGDRSRIEGVVRIEPAGKKSCDRVLEGEVSVRLLGVGSLIERAIVSNTVDAYGRSAKVAAEFAAPHQPSSRPPSNQSQST
jgi:hypothetical protein